MTKKNYQIITNYVKDLSFEIPSPDSFIDAIQNSKSPNENLIEAAKYLKDKNMTQKFIKFTTGSDELYVIPHMISHVRKTNMGKAIVYLFNGQSLHVNEEADEVLKLIKDFFQRYALIYNLKLSEF
jgi:uncharacterized protein YlzI (FlbEa/FlbD family)